MSLPSLSRLRLGERKEEDTGVWARYRDSDYFRTRADGSPNPDYVQAPGDNDWTEADRRERRVDPIDFDHFSEGDWVWRATPEPNGQGGNGFNYNPENYWRALVHSKGQDPMTRGDVSEEAIRDLAAGRPNPGGERQPLPRASAAALARLLRDRQERLAEEERRRPQEAAERLQQLMQNLFETYTIAQMRLAFVHESTRRAEADGEEQDLYRWLQGAADAAGVVAAQAAARAEAARAEAAEAARAAEAAEAAEAARAAAAAGPSAAAGPQAQLGDGFDPTGLDSARLIQLAAADPYETWLRAYIQNSILTIERGLTIDQAPVWLRPIYSSQSEARNVFTVRWSKLASTPDSEVGARFGTFAASLRVREDAPLGAALGYMRRVVAGNDDRVLDSLLLENLVDALQTHHGTYDGVAEALAGPDRDRVLLEDHQRRQALLDLIRQWRGRAPLSSSPGSRMFEVQLVGVGGTPDREGASYQAWEIRIACHDQLMRWLVDNAAGTESTREVDSLSAYVNGTVGELPPRQSFGRLGGLGDQIPREFYWRKCYSRMRGMLTTVVKLAHTYACGRDAACAAGVYFPEFDPAREEPPGPLTRSGALPGSGDQRWDSIEAHAKLWYGLSRAAQEAAFVAWGRPARG